MKSSPEIFLLFFGAIFRKQLYKGKIYIYMTNIRKTPKKIAFSILVYLVKGVTLKGRLQSGLSSTAALFLQTKDHYAFRTTPRRRRKSQECVFSSTEIFFWISFRSGRIRFGFKKDLPV